MFETGEKVVCVDDSPLPKDTKGFPVVMPTVMIVSGGIYVVQRVHFNGGLFLVGIIGAHVIFQNRLHEIPWNDSRFRRLSDVQNEARERQQQDQPIEA